MSQPAVAVGITPARVQFTEDVLSWKDAVALACRPLVDEGVVEPGYVEAIVTTAEKMGPYFDFGRGIAMPHARGDGLVHEPALAYLRTSTPVLLLDDPAHPIDLFIVLAAPDNNSHMSILRTLASVLTDPTQVDALKASTTQDQVAAILSGNHNNH